MEEQILKKYARLSPARQQAVNDYVEFLYGKQREEILLQTLNSLGFDSIADFIEKENQKVNHETKIELENNKTSPAGGIGFVEKRLTVLLKQQIALCQADILLFEQKYGFSLQEMKEKYESISSYDLVEKEMDEMEWEGETRFLKGYQTLLNQIENGTV